jgi:Domain of unknown function (DUF4214)/Ca-dependent carbohydrate-binding module xylan-binding
MANINGTSGNDLIQQGAGGGGSLVIVASGSIGEGNVWPNVNIWVNGAQVLTNVSVTANHAAGATQQIVVPLSGPVTSFAISYTNDDQLDFTLDRNLYLSSVTLNGTALSPTIATYDRFQNGNYFDTIQGQADMVWGGNLNFTGAQVQAAGAGGGGGGGGTVSDLINGLAGVDTVVYGVARGSASIGRNGDGSYTVVTNGVPDQLVSVERLQFSDSKVAIDVNGAGGQAYRLYQAAFDRTPDTGGLGYWINTLDQGASLGAVANAFVGSAEFSQRYGALNNDQFVNQLYLNVLDRNADAGGQAYWTGHLNAGNLARADVLAYFSDSPENQALVIGSIQNGMVYG